MKMSTDLGKDSIPSLVLRLAIPSMIAQFVNVLYSIIDRIYIGHIPEIGDLALAGVGVCGPIVTFLSSFGTLVGLGGSVIMGIHLGERNGEKARQVLANAFLMLCCFSLALTVIFLFSKEKLLMWFGASSITFPYADTYMTIYTAGTFFALMAVGLNYFINCQGFPVAGMATVLIGAVSNILLDPLFIFVFKMDVAGAAIATVISQFASCAFAICFLLSKKVHIKIVFGQYSRKVMARILFLGFSPFMILATDSIILILMNSVLQKYGGPERGDMLITCATIAQSYLLMITAPMLGISGGTQAILSYNYGAQRTDRIKAAEKCILKLMCVFTTVMFLLSRLIPELFVRMFTSDGEYFTFSIWAIHTVTLMIIPLGFQYVFVDGLTAMAKTKTALCLSVFRKSLYAASTVVLPMFFSAQSAFYAEPLADIVGSVLSTTVFLLVINKHLQNREQTIIS